MTDLIRIPFDPRALETHSVANGFSDDDGGYALHHAMRMRFGSAAPQPFCLSPTEPSVVLGYGDGPALDDAWSIPHLDPLTGGIFLDRTSHKPMPEGWREGARYQFLTRVRPVMRF